ncbi:hypothetical protein DFH27DRAFT_158095 [Peziza echinospora]|nr:hypothetical protein DFH27DRAFT_158095 [Peziza echinospora]
MINKYTASGRWAGHALIATLITTIVIISTPVQASSYKNLHIRQTSPITPCAQRCIENLGTNVCNNTPKFVTAKVGECFLPCELENPSVIIDASKFICPLLDFSDITGAATSGIIRDGTSIPTASSTTTQSTRSAASSTTAAPGSEKTLPPLEGEKKAKKEAVSVPIIVGIAVGGIVFLLGIIGVYFLVRCLRRKKQRAIEEENSTLKGKHFGHHSSQSDLVHGIDRGIPLGTRKDKTGGDSWMTDEESNQSFTTPYASGPNLFEKPRSVPIAANLNKPIPITSNLNKPIPNKPGHIKPPPITTNFTKPVPALPNLDSNNVSPPDSPVSPVSPVSHYGALEDRRNKAFSTVSSIKPDNPTHHDYYNFASPPLPTPAPGTAAFGHMSNKPTFLFNAPTDQQEPVSPISRHPSGKSFARSSVSTVGEGHSWEGYRDMIQKYEQQNPELPQAPKSAVVADSRRLSGLSQFNFGFNNASPVDQEKKKRISSFYGWGKKAGYLDQPMTRDKFLSGSSSIYSNQPPSPTPHVGHPGPSTPEIMSGRPPPSYTPPSPQPGRSNGPPNSAVSKLPSTIAEKPEFSSAKLARANSLRWRREVEAATDIALERIATNEDSISTQNEANKPLPRFTRLKRGSTMSTESGKGAGFWQSLLTPKGSISSPRGPEGDSASGSGSQRLAPQHARSEVSLVSEDGNTGVVFI